MSQQIPYNLLVNEAQKIGRHRTKKDAIAVALEEYIARHKQTEVLDMFGTVDYAKDYNYKTARQRKKQ